MTRLEDAMPAEDAVRLRRLAVYALPPSLDPDWFGHWSGGEKDANGVTVMPYVVFSDDGEALLDYLRGDWVLTGFDWPAWSKETGAMAWIADQSPIAGLSVEDMRRFITAIVRANRFSEGVLLECWNKGVFHALKYRAGILAAAGSAAS